jgi:hypothetical protein
MAVFTYILLTTLHSGIIDQFSPLVCHNNMPRRPPFDFPLDSRRIRVQSTWSRPARFYFRETWVLHLEYTRIITIHGHFCVQWL